jgi:hypothetical protein
MPRTVTGRELLIRIDERLKALDESTDEKLKLILIEAKKTNGRVTALETWRDKSKGAWAMLLLVAAATGTIAGLIVNYIRG